MTQNTYSDECKNNKNNTPNTTIAITTPKTGQKKKQRDVGVMWFEGPYNMVRGETSLWVAVITQAMMDALNRSRNAEALYHKHEAIQWLTGNSKDFKLVCMYAGLDHDYVRRKAKRAIVSPVAWRAAPGTGKRYQERRAYRQRLKKNSQDAKLPAPAGESNKILIGPWAHTARFEAR